MIFQNSLGIEIREDCVLIAYLKTFLSGVRLEAHGDYPLERAMPGKEKLSIISGLIKEFIEQHQIASSDIYIGIPREQAIIRTVKFPPAVKENLRSTLKYEIDKYLPLSPEDILFDYQVIKESKDDNFLNTLLVVVKKSDFLFWLELQERIGCGVSGIEVSSTSICNYINILDNIKTDTLAFICSLNNSFEIGIIENRLLTYSKVVSQAEDGGGRCDQVIKELAMLSETGVRCNKLVFIGDGFSDSDFKRIKTETRAELVTIKNQRFELPSDKFIPACGLALKGIKKVPMQINLLPVESRKRPGKVELYAMLILALLVTLSGFAWGSSYVLSQKLYQKELTGQMNQLSAEIGKVERIQAEMKTIEARIHQLEMIEQNRTKALMVLKEISSVIPKTAWVNDFNYTGKDVRMSGYAETASELVSILDASPLLRDVVFLSTITKEKEGKERFNIGLGVK